MRKLFILFVLSIAINTNINAQWQQTNGPFGGSVNCFAENGNSIFAGTEVGLFKSDNYGTSWVKVNNNLINRNISSIIIKNNKIFAGSVGNCGGLYVSSDNGISWTMMNNGMINCPWVFSLIVSGNNIFAGTNLGIYLSTNEGISWTQVNSGLNSSVIYNMAVCGNSVFALTQNGSVYKSINNGTNWTAVNMGLTNSFTLTLVVNGTDIYAGSKNGIYKSSYYGTNWSALNTGLTDTIVRALAINGNYIYAGTYSGVFVSANSGSNWNMMSSGLNNNSINILHVSGTSIYAGDGYGGGIYKSTNNGTFWFDANAGLTGFYIYTIASNGSKIFAATQNGIYSSIDDGQSWSGVNNGLPKTSFYSIAVSDSNVYAINLRQTYMSTNNGVSWTFICGGINFDSTFYSIAAKAGKIYLLGGNGLYSSNNAGLSWTNINNSVQTSIGSSVYLVDTTIFIKTNNGSFYSTNNGASWNSVNSGYSNTILSPFVGCGTNVVAGSNNHGCFLSFNNGTNWNHLSSGLTDTVISSIAVLGSTIYAASPNSGVFRSIDTCAYWNAMNTGLLNQNVNALILCDSNLFASVSNGAEYEIWKYSLSALTLDAGISNIIMPVNYSHIGDTIPVLVKLKNYGTQTLTSLQITYEINGQLNGPVNWTGSLAQDSVIIVQLGQYIVPNINFITIKAYTNLIGDVYHPNDSSLSFTFVVFQHDAGIVDIISPIFTNNTAGDLITPKVKFKNYGLQPITSLQLAYLRQGYQTVYETWTGNLLHDSTAVYTFTTQYFSPSTFYTIGALTLLALDTNTSNDQMAKTIMVNPATKDAGIIEIINPTAYNTNTGDLISPKIKIKNFGNQPITTMQLTYIRPYYYYSYPVTETWNGNLQPDSTVIYTFYNAYHTPSANYTAKAFVHLAGDSILNNDTLYKNITVNPATIDAGIVEIVNPAAITCSGIPLHIKVVIRNNGLTPLTSIPVSYRRNNLIPVNEIWTGAALQYGDTIQYTFTQLMNIPSGTSFAMCAYTDLLNDAYKYNDTICKSVSISNQQLPQNLNITGEDTVVIGQNNIAYVANPNIISYPQLQYVWTLPTGAVLDSSNVNVIFVNYGSNAISGNISCKAIGLCGVTPTSLLSVHVFATPPPPLIHIEGNALVSSYGSGNQWFNASGAISGANQQSYAPTVVGDYYTKVTLAGITSQASNIIHFPFVGIEETLESFGVKVFPNPLTSFTAFYYSLKENTAVRLSILDITGKDISTLYDKKTEKGDHQIEFNAEKLCKGIYFYCLKIGENNINGKLLIIK
ncbi:MAG: T9SS type A sorting domain-containing protein [Bacteroidales bacterium]